MIALRPIRRADFEMLTAMRRDADLQRMLMSDPAAAATEPLEKWLTRRAAQGHLRVIADADNVARGFLQLSGVHRRNATAWLGIAVERAARGRGIGCAAMVALDVWGREELGLRKLKLEVMCENTKAQALYRALGYCEVGVQRAEFFDGVNYNDTLVMEKVIAP